MVSNSVFIFTATTVLIGLDYLLLAANWRVVKALLETLPENQRRVRYSKEDTKDPLIRDKHFVLFIHFMGCVWFGISILTCAVALLGISFAAARVWVGGQQMTNYYQSIWFLLAGILSFGLGLFFVGILHVGDALCVLLGKPNRIVDKLPIPSAAIKTKPDDNASDDSGSVECQDCGTQLLSKDTKCPNCGSTKKLFKEKLGVELVQHVGVSNKHTSSITGLDATILIGLLGIIFTAVFTSMLTLRPLQQWANILISISIVFVLVLPFIFKRVRSRIIFSIHRLLSKLTIEETSHS
jgi:uncharacterized protein (DUF983 family)